LGFIQHPSLHSPKRTEFLSHNKYEPARLRPGNQIKVKSRKNVVKAQPQGEVDQIPALHNIFTSIVRLLITPESTRVE
jgi:hypothetical protein